MRGKFSWFLGVALVFCASAGAGEIRFPPGFKWCVATAAHQIEGGNENSDWWAWEQQPGNIKNGDRSGPACDHWNRLEEDVQLLENLHVRQYRFSVEWAKIEPREGQWDWDAIRHYQREISLLRGRGIEPLVTLHHFTLPVWLAAKGGWESSEVPALFARFAELAVRTLGFAEDGTQLVRDWVTINEPTVVLLQGYTTGTMPPARRGSLKDIVPPMRGMLKAHGAAYHAMKAAVKAVTNGSGAIRIGIAHHLRIFDTAEGWHPIDDYLAGKIDQAFNWAFGLALETGRLKFDIPLSVEVDEQFPDLANTQDFIGVNYYSRDIVTAEFTGAGFSLSVPKGAEVSDLGWEIYPEGLYRTLKSVGKRFPGKPVLITENGVADSSDAKRTRFLERHLEAMSRAMREGITVESYCHWSILDNFEWSLGFTPRFGLYEVDYGTQTRTPRPSARRFAEIARTNSL